jgi:uncharacterized lipoprotein YddW (UPF0748 family)
LKRRQITAASLLALAGCAAPPPGGRAPVEDATRRAPTGAEPPPAPRELRAAWIATVNNIDWPSRPGLPAATQRAEIVRMLDTARSLNLNALVLQVRPMADAIYNSPLEPWSEFLSGEQGRASEAGWDPLATWVNEAHRRGIEVHAWFNPYRAWSPSAKGAAAASHVSRSKPQLVRRYGDLLWMDPGEPEAAAHTLAVVADVLKRYDIDGVHIDDYFYPYPINQADGTEVPFPDDAPFQRYRDAGGVLTRDDWRRDNVNRLVEAMHETVRRVKPRARFGISPFGLGRPDLRPAGIEGFSQYDKLYADVELWVEQGWYDYLAPQLYWAIDSAKQPFPVLLEYWSRQVGKGRHLWPGLYTSSIPAANAPPPSNGRQWKADEIVKQVTLKNFQGSASGHIHFSMIALQQDRDGVATQLRAGPYREAALAPASPWLDDVQPKAPVLQARANSLGVSAAAGEKPFVWAVWRRVQGRWIFSSVPGHQTELALGVEGVLADRVVVSAVSRTGQESARITVNTAAP